MTSPAAVKAPDHREVSITPAIVAGLVTGLVGWSSSFAVYLAGLRAVGATSEQAASGLLVACLAMGLGCVIFSWRWRMPVTMAWSTPGAALLASSAVPALGFRGAVAAFVVCGALIMACGAFRWLERLVEQIPASLASAMLAGVLMTLCVLPFRALADHPATIAPVVAVWLVMLFVARRWSVPATLAAALIVAGLAGTFTHLDGLTIPPPVLVLPAWDPAAMLALGFPLFLVTMTSQNIAGIAVLRSFGYQPRLAPTLVYGGAATAASAFAGGQAVNLAAISASLAASPEAHPDPDRRWIAGVTCGLTYLAFGPLAGVLTEFVAGAPDGLIATVAGLALVPTLTASAASALADPHHREACGVTFIVAATGLTVGGIGGAFWGLLIGGVMWWLNNRLQAHREGRRHSASGTTPA